MLNQIAVFGNEALDATLTAGVSDTVLSKLKIPRTRGMFPAADEFSTATRDCFLRNEVSEPDRIPGWMGTFVGLDNVLAWLVSNTEQLITLPAAELTPNRHAT
ncbi:hypothetical protein BLNAU_15347 [Blattamonas nauphoetae]|uniref:Uncharacterized protein n=1 Tax=Blattamonas nauphoetae TaxID=2049346 RepID=A0ABQ9XEQ2_9EUKA|nr:hypothetical protein BLNAU_15347 [Blattamonas nauphoetae]